MLTQHGAYAGIMSEKTLKVRGVIRARQVTEERLENAKAAMFTMESKIALMRTKSSRTKGSTDADD